MSATRLVTGIVSAAMVVLGTGTVFGQLQPNRPVRIVASGVGGGTDFVARQIANGLTDSLGQQFLVENRGSSVVPGEIVSKASPDGHTLLVTTGGILWVLPFFQKVPYDPVKDFSPVALAASFPTVLVVNASLPANSVKELIALAKTKPGELNYASGSSGASTHLAAELFKSMAGVNIVRISYKGAGPALNAVISGEVQLMFSIAASVAPHAKSGSLRALAVTSAGPSVLAPGLPSVAASGLPGFESASMGGMFGPAKTPVAIINRPNREVVQFLSRADVKEKLLNIGVEAVGSSPEQFEITVKSEIVRLGKVISDAGIRAG